MFVVCWLGRGATGGVKSEERRWVDQLDAGRRGQSSKWAAFFPDLKVRRNGSGIGDWGLGTGKLGPSVPARTRALQIDLPHCLTAYIVPLGATCCPVLLPFLTSNFLPDDVTEELAVLEFD